MTVETPVLDAIVSEWETVRLELHWVSRRYFHDMSWKPSYVIPIALSWTGVLALCAPEVLTGPRRSKSRAAMRLRQE